LDAQLRPDDVWYEDNVKSVIRLRNNDNMCAARSLVILRARADHAAKTLSRDEMRRLVRPTSAKLKNAAIELCTLAAIDTREGVTVDHLQKFTDAMKATICVVSFAGRRIIYRTDWPAGEADDAVLRTYYLLDTGGHYEPITKMNVLQGHRYWCAFCHKGYAHLNGHKCVAKCTCCFQRKCSSLKITNYHNPANRLAWRECSDCFRHFPEQHAPGTVSCFANHIRHGVCGRVWKCLRCTKIFSRARVTPEDHCCSHTWCVSCKAYVSAAHMRDGCFIKKTPLKAPSEKYVFSDIESIQETGVHEANLIISRDWDDTKTTHRNEGDYVKWLLKHRTGHTVVFHNGGGYDLPCIGTCASTRKKR
jgi:hypothetical protein